MRLEEHFFSLIHDADSVHEALERASSATAHDFGEMVDRGMSFREALVHCGIRDADSVRKIELLMAEERPDYHSLSDGLDRFTTARPLKKKRTAAEALYVVIIGGGVNGVPSPECMNAHLPPRGQRSRSDYEKAWKECTK